MGFFWGGVLDLVEGALWLRESKRRRVMRGHEAAKREEDGDKSVQEEEDVAGETFAGIKCSS